MEGVVATRARELATTYRTRVLAGDQAGAEGLIADALLAGLPVNSVCSSVLAAALEDVGRLWELNELSVADEHMATEITAGVILRLLTPRAPSRGPIAVVTSGPDGGHWLGGRILSSLLMARGWRVSFLGGQTPTDALEQFVALRQPDLVAFSVKLPQQIAAVAALTDRLQGHTAAPSVLIGGEAVRGMRAGLAADCVEDDLDAALEWVDRTFGRPGS